MTLTSSESLDKLLYSYIGIRLLSYLFFFILNLYQAIVEGIHMVQKKNKIATRFFIFFFITLFCCCRLISTILFYDDPLGYVIGTPSFAIYSTGTICVFAQWIMILHFWLIIMYSFFVSDEVRLHRIKPINWTIAIFIIVLTIYQTFIVIAMFLMDLAMGQAIGFFILLLIFTVMVFSFGSALLRNLKQHKKNSVEGGFNHFKDMILKTKILLVALILTFVLTLVEELIFQFKYGFKTVENQIISYFLTGVIDTGQMIVVMYVLANGKFRNYLFFKHVKTTSFSSNEKSSLDLDSLNSNKFLRRKSYPSNLELTGNKSFDQSISIDSQPTPHSSSINKINSKNSNTIDIIISSDDENEKEKNNIIINNTNNNNNIYDLAISTPLPNDDDSDIENDNSNNNVQNNNFQILNQTNQEEEDNNI